MDEVDKIIIHSLRQIGCDIEGDAFSMTNFTPELLVKAVASCLQEIKPNTTLPRTLPPGMAQRFSVATALAEQCANCGYRSDIGYQTFLYPNAVDVRRLLMFLVEHLPKENLVGVEPSLEPIGAYEALHNEIKSKIAQQLHAAWVPQFCRAVGNKRNTGCSSQIVKFQPNTNLNVPAGEYPSKEMQSYMQQQAPNVFKQASGDEFDLISSVLHRNALDLYEKHVKIESIRYSLDTPTTKSTSVTSDTSNANEDTRRSKLTPLEELSELVNALKLQNDSILATRKSTSNKISALKIQQASILSNMKQLRKDVKIHERTRVILENPKENVSKLEGLVHTTQERRKTLEQQWQSYRQTMLTNINDLRTAKQAKNIKDVMELRTVIQQLEQALREKTNTHAQLTAELKRTVSSVAPRKEYTRRILEFIGNIRKQRNDIFKVLDDTRDLQKQLNSVTAQLQRQFNYTDDLLFQSAKHDLHAKKAYKLLATLHATCNELVELVTQTGNITKDIRDLEVQIDREKVKNIAVSLQQISADIRNFENVIRNIQTEIRKVENEITAA